MDTRRRRKEVFLKNPIQTPIPPKRITRIHAQRKFASTSGTAAPLNELNELKEKVSNSSDGKVKDASFLSTQQRDNAVTRPKTEDFLTFLCFRGTSVLPPHLECFESPLYNERWIEPKTMTPPEDDKLYKPTLRKDREEVGDRRMNTSKDYVKRNLGPIHVDVASLTPARVTRSSASLTPTPSFLSSPLSSDCSPNNGAQRKLTKNQLLLKKAMLIKSKKVLVKKRNARILLKKKTKAKADSSRVTRSGTNQVQVMPNVPKSPIMACRKTVKASHMSKRKKSLCRMLKRIGIMSDSSQSTVSRKTRSQSDCDSFSVLPKKLDSTQEYQNTQRVGSTESELKEHINLLDRVIARKRKTMSPPCNLFPTSNTVLKKTDLRNALDKRLILKRKRSFVVLGSSSKSSEMKTKDYEHLSRKRKCLSANISSAEGAKTEPHSTELNMRGRPARRTKQVAEVYLELVSQKLAKEAEDGLEVSDEEDNISISSIKELKAVAKAKHKLDMKKCVKEFAEKHDCQKVSPAKTSPLRPRSSSDSTPIKKHLFKRNLYSSDTEDSGTVKDTISSNEPASELKPIRGRCKSKPIEVQNKLVKVESHPAASTGPLKTVVDTEAIGRATVRLNRLKSPRRNSTSPRSPSDSRCEDTGSDIGIVNKKCHIPLLPYTKVRGKLKEEDEPPAPVSKITYKKKSSSPSKASAPASSTSSLKVNLRKIRSDKEIRRIATQFLDARSDLLLPKVKKQRIKKSSHPNKCDGVVDIKKEKSEEKLKQASSSCQRLRRTLSLDEANSSCSLGSKESLLVGLGEKSSTTCKSPRYKSLSKLDIPNSCGKPISAKHKKPLRRKSVHDNTQLSAVLEKIAKDFEKQIDIRADSKMETEIDSGKKSPAKCLNPEKKNIQKCSDTVSIPSASRVSLIIPKVCGTKRLNDVVKNLLEKSREDMIAQEETTKESKDPDNCVESKKVSEIKNHSQNSSPAQSSWALREILPKPVAKFEGNAKQHCTPNSPLKNISLEGQATIEPIKPAIKLTEEPISLKEKSKSVPFIPQVPKPKFASSLDLDANLKPTTNINLTVTQSLPIPFKAHSIVLGGATTLSMPICQLQPTSINPTLGHIAPGIAITQPILTSVSDLKPTKIETTPTKGSSKQILIAPKPSKNNPPGITSASGLKHYQKIIAPKANNGSHPVPASHFASHTPILAAPAMGSLVQTLQHPMQTVQTLPQTLHTMQALPRGVQPIQALSQSFQALGGVAPTVQGVIPHTIPLNTTHLGTASSPAKLLAPPVFVSTSVPNMVATPFDFTVGPLPGSSITPVGHVMAHNAVGKIVPKSQPSIVAPSAHPLVTLGPGTDASILSSFVPLNRPGQPQFLTVSMMPMVSTALSVPATGLSSVTANLPPTVCSQSIAAIAPSLPTFNSAVSTNLNSAVPITSCNNYSQFVTTSSGSASSSCAYVPYNIIKTESIPMVSDATNMVITPAPSANPVGSSNIKEFKKESCTIDCSKSNDISATDKEIVPDCKSDKKAIPDPAIPSTKLPLVEKVDTVSSGNAVLVKTPVSFQSSSLYSPIKPSPALSQALSKLYPLLENKESSIASCSSATSFSPLQINTHIYTSASLISPQPIECGSSRQTAVTKVSQSSPPYLLSTSSSDAHKSIKVPISTARDSDLKSNIPATSYNRDAVESSQPAVRNSVDKECHHIAKNNLDVSEKSKQPIVPLLSTKIFYSSKNKDHLNKSGKIQHCLSDNKMNEVDSTLRDKNSKSCVQANKIPVIQITSCTKSIDTLTIVNSKPSTSFNDLKNSQVNHNTKCVHSKPKSASHIDKPSALPKSQVSSKKEPLLKRTLFRHKSMIEPKSAEAFSAINESSVYAFEPDVDSIDVSTPFLKRLKKVKSEEVPTAEKQIKTSSSCSTIKIKASDSSTVQSTIKKSVHLEKIEEPKRNVAQNRFAKLDVSQIEASVKLDFSSSSSICETEDEDDAPVAIVSIAPVYSNSSAEEELVSDLAVEPKKEPLLLTKAALPEKTDSSLRCVRVNPTSEKPSIPLPSSKCNIRNLRNFKINSNLRRRSVARIPMNQSLGGLLGRFPPNSIHSVSTANSVLASKVHTTVSTEFPKFASGKGTMPSPSKSFTPRSISKPLSNSFGKIKCPNKCSDKKSKNTKEIKRTESSTKESKNKKKTKQPVQSTSIAIQCDLDDDSNQEDKPSESGTQTEGLSKLPLPPSASPFYYLPLAMATLGEELPAQLVQQMLAKTQGLVGETEAKMILRQAAQLAQQYHNNVDGEPAIPTTSTAKPISPKSGNLALQKVLKATFSQAGLAGFENSLATNPKVKDSLSEPKASKSIPTVSNCLENMSNLEEDKEDTPTPAKINKPPVEVHGEVATLKDEGLKLDESSRSSTETTTKHKIPKSGFNPGNKSKLDAIVKRRSGRSSTSASTKATEFDINEAEEIRRNRRVRRAAASFAREEGWSSSSEAPLSPAMSPDCLRGWPPTRLTSPTPSQSSEGTTSSTPSYRSRMSMPRSRKPSPVVARYQRNSALQFPTDPVIDPGPILLSESNGLTRAPSFFPTEEEFNEPLDYIEKIRPEAEHFGLCRIVPPGSFRPECRVNDDMRFAACKQYIHRVMNRWGRNTKVMNAIRKCLAKQKIELTSNPLIGTLELDLVRLYEVVESMGGLMKVIENELWAKVADALRIPKSTQDRLTKLDSIYCTYLLPYAMLSTDERKALLDEVVEAHKNVDSRKDNHSDDEDEDIDEFGEFVVKGKSTALSAFYRMSKNVASQWQPDPDGLKIDERYWNIVKEGARHVCVHTASIDTAEHGYGFPSQKNSTSAKHPWNLKNVCQNPSSVLRSMANVIGVSAPTLHVGMMFSTVCWYRDPHSLPWIEYLHTGSHKIWYGVPSSQEKSMKAALEEIVPEFIKDSPLWLPSDATMIPPDLLIEKGLKVSRIAQEPGQFVVVFPGAFTSSVCSGYLISESAFYARPQYFSRAVVSFNTLRECREPAMFSLDRLAVSVAGDSKASLESLQKARCLVEEIVQREKRERKQLSELGLSASDRMPRSGNYKKKIGRYFDEDEENLCEICKQHLYVSMVSHEDEETGYCLEHAISHLENHPEQLKFCKLIYTYTVPELTSTLKQMDERICLKAIKKASGSSNKRSKLDDNTDSFSSTSSSNF